MQLELASLDAIAEELAKRNISFMLAWFDHTALASRDNDMFFEVVSAGPLMLQRVLAEQVRMLADAKTAAMYEQAEE